MNQNTDVTWFARSLPSKKHFYGNSNWLVEMQPEHSYGMILMADIIKFWHMTSPNTL